MKLSSKSLVMFKKWGKKGQEGTSFHPDLEKFNGSVFFGQVKGLLTLKNPKKNGFKKFRCSKTKKTKKRLQIGGFVEHVTGNPMIGR